MLTKSKTASASSVTNILREDHKKVKGLFEEFEHAEEAKAKQRIVETAVADLEVHSKLEEGLIYPAIRAEIADDDLMNEAKVEHEGARRLVSELESMNADDDMLNAKMHVLCAYIKHHVREEEQDMFPKARDTAST